MRASLQRMMDKVAQALRALPELGLDERIDNLPAKLDELKTEYQSLEQIGRGKDGIVFRTIDRDANEWVVKVLSRYALHYLPITSRIRGLGIDCPALADLQILSDRFLRYAYEPLTEPLTAADKFVNTLIELCGIQIALLGKGVLYWDLGFAKHSNYMLRPDGTVRIIDYGGNCFLFTDPAEAAKIRRRRRNLVYAKPDFVRAAFLLHIVYYGLGQRAPLDWPSDIQHAGARRLRRCCQFCCGQLTGTCYEGAALAALQSNLLSPGGWNRISEALVAAREEGSFICEPADIDRVDFGDGEVRVSGYQNYTIPRSGEVSVATGGRRLWKTTEKSALVESAFRRILERNITVRTFVDIGCNAGLYVFMARQKLGAQEAVGIDYNESYVSLCRRIAGYLGLEGCKFEVNKFSELTGRWHCVLAMGLIHHLYHRTEGFGSIEAIMARFAQITGRVLVIEFPLETDPKAGKWTNIKGRISDEEYSHSNFLSAAARHFGEVVEIGRIDSTRVTYLLIKDSSKVPDRE